ncbi:MAG: AMP-binding protein, partial [Candidatus Aminicenantes bacterium]
MFEDKLNENLLLFSPKFIRQREYWIKKLAGLPEDIGKTELFFTNKMQPTSNDNVVKTGIDIPAQLSHQLLNLSNQADLTLYIILLAGLKSLVYRYSNCENCIVVSPVYELNVSEETINNFLLIHDHIDENMTFKELLLTIRQTVLEAYENQDYPFNQLIDYLSGTANIPIDASISYMQCSLKNIHGDNDGFIENLPTGFHFSFIREENRVRGQILYPATGCETFYVEQMARHFARMLENLLSEVNTKISEVPYLANEEKERLIVGFNNNRADFPRDKTIFQFIEGYAAEFPHRVALGCEENHITYRELNQRSHHWAGILKERGLQKEEPVGILLDRKPLMVENILGVWKAGSAYIPLDPQDPVQRIRHVLADSGSRVLLTDSDAERQTCLRTLQHLRTGEAGVVITGIRPQITDFDSIPFPDRSLINYETYGDNIGLALVGHAISIQASRGCPYKCAYCHKIWPKKHIPRQAENIFDEVKLYYDLGIRRFALIDDIFNFNRKNSMKFFRLLIDHGMEVQLFFPNGVRGDLLDQAYIDLMIEAGTVGLALALETASPRLQKLIKKNLNLEKLEENIRYICKKYPQVILELFTMLGFPTETQKEALMTLEFIKRQKWLHFPYVEILKIFPNTDMEALALEAGITKEAIARSQNLAYHELPETLPFDKQFTLKYQTDFFSGYFLSKERLLHVLPWQMKSLTESEMAQKYNSYLPVDINNFSDLLEFTGISRDQLGEATFVKDLHFEVPGLHEKMKQCFPKQEPESKALKVLLLDLSQYFSKDSHMLYDVSEPPLGLMYLLTYLNHRFPGKINGKIAKSRVDFDSYDELKQLLAEFAPHLVGARSLTFYKDFFHQTAAIIREWGFSGPLIVGGPYATSDYQTLLHDRNIDIVVRGEGELTFSELIKNILENGGELPGENILEQIPGLAFVRKEVMVRQTPRLEILKPDILEKQQQEKTVQTPEYHGCSQNLAYIIYTSGSTGTPKGAMIEHLGMMNHLQAKINDLEITPASIVSQNSPHTFDISVWQFFAALAARGKTVIYPNRLVWEPDKFLTRLEKDRVTILEVVPSYLSAIFATLDLTGDSYLGKIHYLLVTGEEVKPPLVKKVFEQFPGLKVVNAYGPTEASDDITHHIMDRDPEAERIPIGKTVQNLNIYMVDKHMNLCPVGIKGELVVSGPGVGRGYLNEVEKTMHTFTTDPFPGKKGHRLYKTGDLGLRTPDGVIEFFGRKDHQAKIAGFRIEPGEIENKLIQHPKVEQAVVLVKNTAAANTGQESKHLCAYLKFNGTLDVVAMKDYLQEDLPYYMVPTHFAAVDEIPLTPNGKVDRNALLDIEIETRKEYIAPRTDLEKELAEIWEQVLGVEKVGCRDNFFEIGGNSIKGIRAVNRIQKQLSEVIHVTALFEAPTIEELARMIEGYRNETHTKVDAAKVAEFRRFIPTLAPMKVSSSKNPSAVFILSAPRSGTTLLRVILAGNPGLFAPPELELLSFNTLQDRKRVISEKYSYLTEGTIRAIMDIKKCPVEEAGAIMTAMEERGVTTREFYRTLQEWLGHRRLVDKSPYYSLDIDVLKRAEQYFEKPQYIHLQRNPYAMIHSFEKAKMDQLFWYEHHFSVIELAELIWQVSHQNIVEFLHSIPTERKHAVKFEDLVQHPDAVVAEICDFLHIQYNQDMIKVYEKTANRMTNGIYPESKMLGDFNFFTHSDIDSNVLNKWKKDYKTDFLGEMAIQLAKSFGYLEEGVTLDYTGLTVAAHQEDYELSPAQQRLWFLHQLDETHIAYNILIPYLVEGDLNINVLEKAYETAVKRHESLRTTFVVKEGEPRQKIHDIEISGFKLEYIDLRKEVDPGKQAKNLVSGEAAAPFDLEHGPLFKVKLIHINESKYVLLLNMHHIISDGWSMRLLISEILMLYDAYKNNRENPLPPPQFQYKDFSSWQNSEKMQEALERQEAYWLGMFQGEIPVLNLPADYRRPVVQSFAGGITAFDLDTGETTALNQWARSGGASPFMVLLAVYNIFLSKISSQEDIVVGTPIAGRNHPDLEKIVGVFVNTLALRNQPSGEKSFTAFLHQVRKTTLEAFANQNYQFEDLVEKINVKKDMSRNPLFDVMFTFRETFASAGEMPQTRIKGLNIGPYPLEHIISKFDLSLSAIELGGKFHFSVEYCSKLFNRETIVRFGQYFKNIISSIIADPGKKIREIEIISAEEKKQLLVDFNQSGFGYPGEQTIHQWFEEQVSQTPDHIAVKCREQDIRDEKQFTYRELNEKSHQLAHRLRAKGGCPDTLVGLMVERSFAMIIGMLGILKAGGAYLPIDPEYPQERIKYILTDSKAKILLAAPETQVKVKAEVEERFIEIIDISSLLSFSTLASTSTCQVSPANLAYVIYTSGSTGRPKGVLVEHGNVVRLVKDTNYICWQAGDKLLLTGSISFDITTFEIWGPLLNGLTLYLAGQDVILDGKKLKEILVRDQINILHLIPQLCNQLVEQHLEIFSGLDYFLVGGDLVRAHYVNQIRNKYKDLKILHMYGPTENTTFSTFHPVEKSYKTGIPIGKPISHSTVYILDKYHNLVPIGVSGSLVIGGSGTARGYLNRPELTNYRFSIRSFCGGFRGAVFSKSAPL